MYWLIAVLIVIGLRVFAFKATNPQAFIVDIILVWLIATLLESLSRALIAVGPQLLLIAGVVGGTCFIIMWCRK